MLLGAKVLITDCGFKARILTHISLHDFRSGGRCMSMLGLERQRSNSFLLLELFEEIEKIQKKQEKKKEVEEMKEFQESTKIKTKVQERERAIKDGMRVQEKGKMKESNNKNNKMLRPKAGNRKANDATGQNLLFAAKRRDGTAAAEAHELRF
ncbi:hypothetical protein PUN28_019721 [Cardiocondyla obscurior]|uniref:Uncharacterized protein n=1 Tax=Cardiocondyla obscurior TaxID=286306 RepID=A0AAW2EAY6_9HYME